VAGVDRDSVLVAYDRGGYVKVVVIELYENVRTSAKRTGEWVLAIEPESLRDLLDRMPPKCVDPDRLRCAGR
jgi:hypothetical protein